MNERAVNTDNTHEFLHGVWDIIMLNVSTTNTAIMSKGEGYILRL